MDKKQIHNYLVIDWKNESTRTRQTEPRASDLGANEVMTEVTIDVVIPDVQVDELTARVEVPQPRVEATELDDLDADGVVDWQDVADEVLEDFADVFGWSREEWAGEEDQYILRIMEGAPGRPEVDEVRSYCRDEVRSQAESVEV